MIKVVDTIKRPSLILKDQQGWVSIAVLILIPLFMVIIAASFEMPRTMHGANTDLKKAVEQGVKSSVLAINRAAQANGSPVIVPKYAYNEFARILQANLLLDSGFKPKKGSGIEEVLAFEFVVINGKNKFEEQYVRYAFDSENGLSRTDLTDLPEVTISPQQKPPQALNIYVNEETGFNYSAGGQYMASVESPSCVAWVKVKLRSVVSKEDNITVRWGIGRIVNIN